MIFITVHHHVSDFVIHDFETNEQNIHSNTQPKLGVKFSIFDDFSICQFAIKEFFCGILTENFLAEVRLCHLNDGRGQP